MKHNVIRYRNYFSWRWWKYALWRVYILGFFGCIVDFHNIDNMLLYNDFDGAGWVCWVCGYTHPDIASYKIREGYRNTIHQNKSDK